MTIQDLREALLDLSFLMDDTVEMVVKASNEAQDRIYQAILKQLNQFEVKDGRFVVDQNYGARMAVIDRQIKEILGEVYRPSIKEYLSTYSTIEETTIALNKSYNQLVIEKSLLTPARRSIYNQAEYYLTEGLADAYIQPAKYLLMQQVSTGVTIKDAERVLRNWNDGELTSGKLASGRQTPNLQKYARQISVDSIHQYNGTIQQVIKDEFQLTKGVYVGDIIKDSRPFCKHMVGMKRKIEIDEIPDLIKRFPDGIIPGTTKKNFSVYRGGYGCRHLWMWVK